MTIILSNMKNHLSIVNLFDSLILQKIIYSIETMQVV